MWRLRRGKDTDVHMPGAVRRAGTSLLAGASLWAVLVTLGVAPTLVGVAAWAVAEWTGDSRSALVAALTVALLANLVLAAFLIRARRYAAALVADMELIGRMYEERRSPLPSWLPNEAGILPINNATLEAAYASALEVARAIGADADLGVGWVSLSGPLISFNGFTPSGRKRMRIWCAPGAPPQVVQLQRADRSPYPIPTPSQLPWRVDPTWPDLVAKSWVAESPFRGVVTLWPRPRRANTAEGEGSWRIEYAREDAGVIGRSVYYMLDNGQLRQSLNG
jgi:hypothetical protein